MTRKTQNYTYKKIPKKAILNSMFYLNNTKYNILFAALLVFLVLIDLGQFFLVGTPLVPFLFCLYCVLLLHHNQHYIFLVIMALLQCLETFCFYNFFSLAFIYLIPVTALALFFKKHLYPSHTYAIILALIGGAIQTYAVEGYFIHLLPTIHYTLIRISGTLLITICFSLTINIWGMQDNRG